MSSSDDLCNVLYKLAEDRNGENVETVINGVRILIVQRLDDADYILRRNADNYVKNMAWFRQALGPSRITEEGEAWRYRMKLSQTHLAKFDRQKAFELSCAHARNTVRRLIRDSAAGATVLSDVEFRSMTAGVFLESFFDRDLEETSIDLARLAELMEAGSAYSFVPAGQTTSFHKDILRRLPGLRREILNDLRSFREEKPADGSLMELFLHADRSDEHDFLFEHEMVMLLAAGTETSAATMGWACYLLAKHPDLQERLHRCATDFWQSEKADWERLNEIQELANFISETLRLYPPTPVILKLAIAPDRIGDFSVTAGETILISFVGIQLDKNLRPDPWSLDLGNASANGPAAGRTTSFSIGPRVCGGKHFALVETVTFLSVFLREARFELISDTPPRFHWKSQMLRKGGHPVRVLPRHP